MNNNMIIQAITLSPNNLCKYSVYFYGGDCLILSDNPEAPQGLSQFTQHAISDKTFKNAANNQDGYFEGEILINFYELPENIQNHIQRRLEDERTKRIIKE